jgi:hypothetical protein
LVKKNIPWELEVILKWFWNEGFKLTLDLFENLNYDKNNENKKN